CSGSDATPRNRQAAAGGEPARTEPVPHSATPPDAPAFTGNLMIITIDTLRADRVNPKTMPTLAAFPKDATWFTHVYPQAPNTPRSFPSFLTSRFPSQIKWVKESLNFSPILDENET